MKVLFLGLFAIIIIAVVIYFTFILKIKVYITFNQVYLCLYLRVLFIKVRFSVSRKYFDYIRDLILNESEGRSNFVKRIGVKRLIKPFFIKNIGFYFDVHDNKIAAVIKFTVVNTVLKRGVFSE